MSDNPAPSAAAQNQPLPASAASPSTTGNAAEVAAAKRRAHEAATAHQQQGQGTWVRQAEPSQSERQQRDLPEHRATDPANPRREGT